MCEAIRLSVDDFSVDQVKPHQLLDFVSEGDDGELIVTFHRRAKSPMIPYRHNGQLQLASWPGVVHLNDFENGSLTIGELTAVEIPAASALQGGVWFDVAPRSIRGFIVPALNRGMKGYHAYILVKPASDYYERMTHYGWEPVYVGEESDPAKTD